MNSAYQPWFGVISAALFALLLFLREKFPNASKKSEMAVLVGVAVLFFSGCGLLLGLR